MSNRFLNFTRSAGFATLALVLAACTGTGFPAHAQTQDNIPVIVMPEDSDSRTIKRSDDG